MTEAEIFAIPAANLLSNEEFTKIHYSSDQEFAALSEELQRKYFATKHFRAGERQKIHLDGIVVGKLSADDILAGKEQP